MDNVLILDMTSDLTFHYIFKWDRYFVFDYKVAVLQMWYRLILKRPMEPQAMVLTKPQTFSDMMVTT